VLAQKIPIMSGPRCIERASPERLLRIAKAPNVLVVRQRKTGTIVEVQVLEFGDDSRLPSKWSNPLKLSTNHETCDNPRCVWTLKKLFPRRCERLEDS